MRIKGDIVKNLLFKTSKRTGKALSAKGGILLGIIAAIAILIFSLSGNNDIKNLLKSSDAVTVDTIQTEIPDVSKVLTDTTGETYNLATRKGIIPVIFYFFNTNCAICNQEIKNINNVITSDLKQTPNDYLFFAISNEDKTDLSAYANQVDKQVKLVSDSNNQIRNAFGIYEVPEKPVMFLYNKNQQLIHVNYSYINQPEIINLRLKEIFNNLEKPKNIAFYKDYPFVVDYSYIQNGCIYTDKKDYVSIPNVIKVPVSGNINDDLANCIDVITPKYTKSLPVTSSPDEQVYYFNINGITAIFPKKYLTYHPYLETYAGSIPIGILYDGLTDTINVFERLINGKELKFIHSGRVYNSKFLLFDTDSYSLWNGDVAIGGGYSGYKLWQINAYSSTLKNFSENSNTYMMTSPNIVFNYEKDALEEYKKNDKLLYKIINPVSKLANKTEVLKIDQDYLVLKDLNLPYVWTNGDKKYLVNKDSTGGIKVWDTKIGGEYLIFDITDKIKDNLGGEWSKDMQAISGKYKGNYLEEVNIKTGYYFYLIQ